MSRFNLSAWAIRERSLTLYLILVTAVAGLLAFLYNGRAEDPSFSVNTMVVSVFWPGATVEQMENQVVDRLEARVEEIDWFDRVETKVRPGEAHLLINFADNTPHGISEQLFYQVRKRLGDEVRNLPPGVIGPVFRDDFKDVYFTLYALTGADGPVPQRLLVQAAEKLRIALRREEGVKKVVLIGERPRQIFIDIDPERLAALGVTLSALRQQIAAQVGVLDAGFVDTAGPRLHLRVTDSPADQVARLRALPINVNGRVLHLGELARIWRGYEDPPRLIIESEGREAVLLGVVMKPNFNGVALEDNLRRFVAERKALLPAGVRLTTLTSQGDAIHLALDTFQHKFFAAVAVVMLVSFIALGLRAGIVVALAVPLTLGMAFVFMKLAGIDFNRVSLGALIIALGLLVDDAIISIEMMLLKMEQGLEKVKAASYAWTVTAAPMLVGTLVTVTGFLPIGLAPSKVGEYAGGIFWVTGIALIASWLVAVWFTPYLGVRLLPERLSQHAQTDLGERPFFRALRRVIVWCVHHRWTVIALTVLVFAASVVAMKTVVVKQFFPSSNRPELMVDIWLPQGSSIEATRKVAERLQRELEQEKDLVRSMSLYVGQGAPRFFLALNPEQPNPSYASLVVVTRGLEARETLQRKLQARIDAGAFPEARVRVQPLLFGPPVPWPVVFRVYGPDTQGMIELARRIRDRMMRYPQLIDPHLSWQFRAPVLRIEWDSDRLSALGLTPAQVAGQLRDQLNGAVAGVVREDIRSTALRLRAGTGPHTDPARLGSLPVHLPDGTTVPLAHLSRLTVDEEWPYVERRNRERVVSVYAEVRPGVQPPDITMKVWRDMQDLVGDLPPGWRVEIGGSVEESTKAQDSIKVGMPLMILIATFLIMLYLRSFSGLIMTLLTAPLGLIGAVVALVGFQQPYGFVANLGVIALGGILMRNTLILVAQINDNLRQGMAPGEAVIEATTLRARPVLLTAAAAALAFIPLTTSIFWGPMAYVLIGGVVVGTLITLFFLPALYAAWYRVKTG